MSLNTQTGPQEAPPQIGTGPSNCRFHDKEFTTKTKAGNHEATTAVCN